MKKCITLVVMITLTATATLAAEEAKPEMKPITKAMLARLGWVQSLSKNIAYSNYDGIAKDAMDLSAQTKKAGETAPAPFNKEKNLAISALASSMAEAAAAKNGAAVSAKFGEILATCNSCHAKLRDK